MSYLKPQESNKMVKRVVCSALNMFVFILYIQMVSSEVPTDEVSAMASVYDIIQNNTGSSFMWSNVLRNSSPCSWKGVRCSSDDSSITSVSLRSFSVSTSEFLPFLCDISTLESVDVSKNQLSSIPDGFYTVCGGISGLKLLNFSGNDLSGSLPSFNGFTVLEKLDFSSNLLFGEVTTQFDGLGSLKSLDISSNMFTGKIPTNLGKMNVLEELVLSGNNFTGEIPLEITKYKNLRVIDLSANLLSGSIPRELGELTMLETLVLSVNNLTGSIPCSLSNITTLNRFAAHLNKLTGNIPTGVTSNLGILDLSYNTLTGEIPFDLLSGPNLHFVDLSFNELEGPIPAINSTKLQRLRLSSNYLSGTIPSSSISSLAELMYLELNNNSLSGEIPLELGMCKKLALLNLTINELVGILPPVLGDLTNLEVLNLELNNFVGAIPPQLSQLTRLGKVNMNGNSLNGSVSSWVSNLTFLIELQLGDNQLSGPIPDMPLSLQIALNLSYNHLSGPIPVSLTKLGRLLVLDLSNNQLSGEVPEEMNRLLSLNHLILSNNELSGYIPMYGPNVVVDLSQKKKKKNVVVDITGNENLTYPRYPTSDAPLQREEKSNDSDFLISVGSGIPVGLLISILVILISGRYNRVNGHLSPSNSVHRSTVDFKKVMKSATDPSNIILKAGFSTFYKAVMPSGTTYLVKKMKHSNQIFHFPRYKELVEELEVFENMSNSNVMIPVAYVLTVQRAYLVYEFVRGTLHDFIHHRTGCRLDWATRYTIAVGVAQGLAFLHECNSGSIILLDLCSKTILLKSIDEPRICDIELCNLIHPSMRRDSLSAGYVAPEYASTERVTAAGNVYSFGVVLLELITGKPAVSGGTELAKWVWSRYQHRNNWDEILDSNIGETSEAVRNQMLAVLRVALACVRVSPDRRPNTITLLQMLLSIRLHN